jgi:hypothetical protein
MKILKMLAALSCLCYNNSTAATLKIVLSVSSGGELQDQTGAFLSGGAVNIAGDGTLLQAGYYTLGTASNPFLGQWIPITGSGTLYPTTIGDGNKPDGQVSSIITLDSGTLGFVEPPVGTRLALRFYNAGSIAAATHFNAVTSTKGSFDWQSPSIPEAVITLHLPEPFIIWQDGSGSAYRTTIAIPEPSSAFLLSLTAGLLAFRRLRRA